MSEYIVLIPCRNDETGDSFEPGDVIDESVFGASVIDNWLEIEPPVLARAFVLDELAADEEE